MVGVREFITYPESISPKVNVLTWAEFELTTHDILVKHVSNDITQIPPFVQDITMNRKFLLNNNTLNMDINVPWTRFPNLPLKKNLRITFPTGWSYMGDKKESHTQTTQ